MHIDFKGVVISGKRGRRKGLGNEASAVFTLQCFISLNKSEENMGKLTP